MIVRVPDPFVHFRPVYDLCHCLSFIVLSVSMSVRLSSYPVLLVFKLLSFVASKADQLLESMAESNVPDEPEDTGTFIDSPPSPPPPVVKRPVADKVKISESPKVSSMWLTRIIIHVH